MVVSDLLKYPTVYNEEPTPSVLTCMNFKLARTNFKDLCTSTIDPKKLSLDFDYVQ